MSYKKGQSGNPNGKPKGAKNKVTLALKERVQMLVENNFEKIEADLKKLEPRERVQAIIKLMEFVLSKQNKHEIEATRCITGFNIIIPDGYTPINQ